MRTAMTDGAADTPERMSAVLLTGHGGFDRLEYRTDVPVPHPGAGEVLIRVAAAGVNNTGIDTPVACHAPPHDDEPVASEEKRRAYDSCSPPAERSPSRPAWWRSGTG